MPTTLAIIQRTGIITDSDWNDIESAQKLLRLLSAERITSVLIWRGTTKTKEGRIEDVFKPFSKLATRLKHNEARLAGAIFIDADSASVESQLEPEGAAIQNALDQYNVASNKVVMIASEPLYLDAAKHLGINVISPDDVIEWLSQLEDAE